MTRRRVLEWLVGAMSGAIGLAIAVPAAAFLGFPARRRVASGGDEPLDVAALAQLPDGKPVRVTVTAPRRRDAWTAFSDVTLGACWLVRRGDDVCALSTVCPHAGCAVDFDAGRDAFVCPCHDSVFALDGARRSGPAPRAMDRLDTVVAGGRVRIAWRRFRTATAKKEPV